MPAPLIRENDFDAPREGGGGGGAFLNEEMVAAREGAFIEELEL